MLCPGLTGDKCPKERLKNGGDISNERGRRRVRDSMSSYVAGTQDIP